jgi:hypothetical protein
MPPKNPTENHKRQDGRHNYNFALIYWQQEGARYYLRVTPLGIYILVFLLVASISAMLLLFLSNRHYDPAKEVNVNITTPPATPVIPTKSIIKPAPSSATPPKVNNRLSENNPGNKRQHRDANNSNEQESHQP